MKDDTIKACAAVTALGIGCTFVLAKFALVIGGIYAAVHFISKYW